MVAIVHEHPPDPARLTADLKERARELGFDLVGVTSAAPFEELQRVLLRWMERGLFDGLGEITEESIRRSCDPQALLPGARSIVSAAICYLTRSPTVPDDTPRGRVGRFAWGGDYTELLSDRLHRLVDFLADRLGRRPRARIFANSGAILDRGAAERAGVGWQGKHTGILTRRFSSWVLLGEIVTDVELVPDEPAPASCGTCRRCIDACPTEAIVAPYEVDVSRCIAYLTVEHQGPIPEALRPRMGAWVFGCDICQEVCPWSQRAVPLDRPEFKPSSVEAAAPSLIPLLGLSAEGFATTFGDTPLRRAGRTLVLRNAAVALGNLGDPSAVPALADALDDPEPLVRGHAAWALGRIGGPSARRALEEALAREEHPNVRGELQAALSSLAAG
ncbi:MAG TPA: tRNA epoxyqueuosine(34) reductase QueG [Chloroflexota bacterium]